MYQNEEKYAEGTGFSKFEEVTSNSQWLVSSSVSFKKESLGQKPIFIEPLSSLRVHSGETVRFHARVSGIPKPEIQWFHNQQPILPTKDLVFHFEESTGMALMLLVDAYSEHAGQYSCKAANCAGEATCAATLAVTPEESLDLKILFFFLSLDYTVQALDRQSSEKNVKESTKSQAVADSSFTKEEIKIFQKEVKSFHGSLYEEVQVFESVSQSSTHTAASVRDTELHHAASLSQIAESTELSEKYGEEAPKILLHLQDLTVKCGDTAQFLCVLEDESSTDVTWTHEGVKVEESERVKQSQDGNTQFLTVCNVQLVDQGLYSCIAHNEYGEKTTAAVLRRSLFDF
ncbi:LOW QUALITY PROTEIN: myosin light chain kinase, smooth muscle-like [Trichechus inunguis]